MRVCRWPLRSCAPCRRWCGPVRADCCVERQGAWRVTDSAQVGGLDLVPRRTFMGGQLPAPGLGSRPCIRGICAQLPYQSPRAGLGKKCWSRVIPRELPHEARSRRRSQPGPPSSCAAERLPVPRHTRSDLCIRGICQARPLSSNPVRVCIATVYVVGVFVF